MAKNLAIEFAGQFQSVLTDLNELCVAQGVTLAEAVPLLAQPKHAESLGRVADELARVIYSGHNVLRFRFAPSSMRQQLHWELICDEEFTAVELVLEPVSVIKPGERMIMGDTIRDRAILEMGAFGGQRLAEFLLAHQKLIPVDLRNRCELAFPGTLRRGPENLTFLPVLIWWKQWELHWRNLGEGFLSSTYVLRLKAALPNS